LQKHPSMGAALGSAIRSAVSGYYPRDAEEGLGRAPLTDLKATLGSDNCREPYSRAFNLTLERTKPRHDETIRIASGFMVHIAR